MAGSIISGAAARVPRLALYAPLRSSVTTATVREPTRGFDATTSSTSASLSDFADSLRQLNRADEGNGSALFAGVEASLADLGDDVVEQMESADLLRTSGLELLVNVDIDIDIDNLHDENNTQSSRDASGSGSAAESSSKAAVKAFEKQLLAVANLGGVVAHINCRGFGSASRKPCRSGGRSGGDPLFHEDARNSSRGRIAPWDEQTTLEYLLDALPLSARFLEDHPHVGEDGNETDVMGGSPTHLTGISHETTTARGDMLGGDDGDGMLRHPSTVRYLLEVIPPLRLTMNLSAWHDVCGYTWGRDADEAEALSVEIVPHIDLIRARTSFLAETGSMPAPDDPASPHTDRDGHADRPVQNGNRFRAHQAMWEDVWMRKTNRGVERILMTLEDDGDGPRNGTTIDEKERRPSERQHANEHNYERKIKRLRDSANRIHQYYDTYSTHGSFSTHA